MNITIRQLSYFRALVQERHFGRAAQRVNVSQPALSMQIKELESQLNVQLVERHTREVIITPIGHEVLRRAEQILGGVADLKTSMRWHTGLSGRLSIGIIPTIAPYLLPVALPMLRGQNIALDLKVREANTKVLLADLAHGRLDVAILALPSGQADLFFEQALFVDRFLLAGAEASLKAARGANDFLQAVGLDPAQLLLLEEGHCLADQALEACSLDRSATHINLGASSLTTLCGLVSAGFGLTFLPEIAVLRERAASQDLALSRFHGTQPQRQIGMIRRRMTRDDGWFADLAAIFAKAGAELTREAERVFPSA